MKNYMFLAVMIGAFSSFANAADHRSMCKKYFSTSDLGNCIARQEASERRLQNGTYYNYVAASCIERNKLVDRVAVYVNFVGADKCAIIEQRRIEEQENFDGSPPTKKVYREHYYKVYRGPSHKK